jgi:hypothetical protein
MTELILIRWVKTVESLGFIFNELEVVIDVLLFLLICLFAFTLYFIGFIGK